MSMKSFWNGLGNAWNSAVQGVKDFFGIGQTTSLKEAEKTRDVNTQLSKENLDLTEKMNNENIRLQKELNQSQLDYARELNSLEMARADTAHQREVADLLKAGLSPYSTMNGADVGSFSTPTLSAPVNDIAGFNSAYNNMITANNASLSAIQGAIGLNQTAQNNRLNETSDLLNFIQNEQKLLHQKDVDEDNISLAREQFGLDKQKQSWTQEIQSLNYGLQNNIYKTQDEKAQAEIKLAVAQTELENIKKQQISLDMSVTSDSNRRSEEKHKYEQRLMETEWNQAIHNLNESILTDSLKRELLKINIHSSEAEFEHLAEKFKIDKRVANSDTFKNYCIGLSGALASVGSIAKTVVGVLH